MAHEFAIHIAPNNVESNPWKAAYADLVKLAARPEWPTDVQGFNLLDRAVSLLTASGLKMPDHEVVLIVTGGRKRPEHPPVGINMMPAALAGWFLRIAPKGTPLVDMLGDFKGRLWFAPEQPVEDLSLVPESDFSHISDAKLAELLGCYRMLNFQNYPAWTKGQDVPHGVQLLEEVQKRLNK